MRDTVNSFGKFQTIIQTKFALPYKILQNYINYETTTVGFPNLVKITN